mmetsp:Transcript_11469/g.39988  ORF Transcript_11469/g.39988 Transcript_11469/m.39988 type:complete len:241 (+) Transcript_11469:442-1164(+)
MEGWLSAGWLNGSTSSLCRRSYCDQCVVGCRWWMQCSPLFIVNQFSMPPVKLRALLGSVSPTGLVSHPSCCRMFMVTMPHCAIKCGTHKYKKKRQGSSQRQKPCVTIRMANSRSTCSAKRLPSATCRRMKRKSEAVTAPATVGWKSSRLRKFHLYCILLVRMMSRRHCVNLWWLRLWPGTYDDTGWPYVSVNAIWNTLFAQYSLNTLQCMVLCVMVAPTKASHDTHSHSGSTAHCGSTSS